MHPRITRTLAPTPSEFMNTAAVIRIDDAVHVVSGAWWMQVHMSVYDPIPQYKMVSAINECTDVYKKSLLAGEQVSKVTSQHALA